MLLIGAAGVVVVCISGPGNFGVEGGKGEDVRDPSHPGSTLLSASSPPVLPL